MAYGPEPAGVRVQAAAARTSATGSARLSFGRGAPALAEQDRLGHGVVDFTAHLAQTSELLPFGQARENLPEALTRPQEKIYDGAAELMRSGDAWVAFGDAEPEGPCHHNHPLWPLDALFGAGDNVIEVGTDTVRDVSTTHYRLTVDLTTADELLPAGIVTPEGPFRVLRQLPTEMWLDTAGLARRIAIRNAAGNRHVWQVVEFWEFGIPVTITRPDPSQITSPGPAEMARIFMENES